MQIRNVLVLGTSSQEEAREAAVCIPRLLKANVTYCSPKHVITETDAYERTLHEREAKAFPSQAWISKVEHRLLGRNNVYRLHVASVWLSLPVHEPLNLGRLHAAVGYRVQLDFGHATSPTQAQLVL